MWSDVQLRLPAQVGVLEPCDSTASSGDATAVELSCMRAGQESAAVTTEFGLGITVLLLAAIFVASMWNRP